MVDRILQLIREKSMTPSQFADEIGVQRSGISHILSGRNKPSLEFVMKMLKRFPDIGPEWLLYGSGDSAKTVDEGNPDGPVQDQEPVKENEVTLNQEMTLFDEVPVKIPENKPPAPKAKTAVVKETNEKKIEKIVIFYNDRTFREYQPEN